MPRGPRPKPLSDRLFSRVQKQDSGCWEFTGSTAQQGYGSIYDHSKRRYVRAHRAAWELKNGPIPEGLFICHKCDNPCCVNPDHLFAGTHQDNVNDREAKGRGNHSTEHLHHGFNRFAAKLTPEQVRSIREKASQGARPKDLAKEFNTHAVNVRLIIRRKTWQDV